MSEKKEQKVYMPLMIGDWLKGTRGMKAEVRGVYINLLLYQWDNGYIPADMEELLLIDPELPKVWDKLKAKFIEVAPGKLQNQKNEAVRDFWKKQKKNGGKGGRPKKNNPKVNPNINPNLIPKGNHHNDLELDSDLEGLKKKEPEIIPEETDESLQAVEFWTSQILDGNDWYFSEMIRKHGLILDGQLEPLARDHLGKCARYSWHEKMATQHAFRHSLLNFITENLKSGKNGKPAPTLEEIRSAGKGYG